MESPLDYVPQFVNRIGVKHRIGWCADDARILSRRLADLLKATEGINVGTRAHIVALFLDATFNLRLDAGGIVSLTLEAIEFIDSLSTPD